MSESLALGSTFARCRIEAVAGRGGMGVVYRATQLALGRQVAVKAIAPELAEDASYRERFKRESQLAALIDHPNIIPVYEAGESDGSLYLIMRWVDGTDLRAMLGSSGRLAPARATRLLRPVASALAAAHHQGLVHRDIKPANVLIAPGDDQREEHVYLTDFGIARRTATESAMTSAGMFVGTVDYMAPERFVGGKGDSASDIYSFGCMLFEALSGQVPFDRPSNVAKVFAHVNDPVPSVRTLVPEVPEWLDLVVAKAMAKRPEDRFASAGALTRALDEALDDLDARARVSAPQTVLSEASTGPAEPQAAVQEVATPTRLATAGATRLSATAVADEKRAGAPPKRRRRGGLWAAGAVLLAALAVVAVIAIGGSGGGHGSSQSSAAQRGPASSVNEVTTISAGMTKGVTIALGSVPRGVAIAPVGDAWVSLPDRGTVVRIAPTGSVTRFAVGGRPGLIAAGPAGIWISGSSSGALARLDERTGRPIANSSLAAAPSALAADFGDGSAWAADSNGEVVHIDTSGSVSGQSARVSPPARDLGVGEGWVWAVNGAANGLVRISPDGSGSTTTFDTHPVPVSVTFDQGVWTAHAGGHVTRFDPRPGFLDVNTDVAVAPSLDAIDAIENQPSVWAISKQTQTLYRISTTTGASVSGTARFASAPVALAVGASSVWVATEDGNVTKIGF